MKQKLKTLKAELSSVLPVLQQLVHRKGGMRDDEFISLAMKSHVELRSRPQYGQATHDDVNSDVTQADEITGEKLITSGEVAFLIMAGGLETDLQPKILDAIPNLGLSLLGWKLLQCGNMPVWIMTSSYMTQEIQRHISNLAVPVGMDGVIFEQFEGYGLTSDNRLDVICPHIPCLYPLGNGDVGPALVESGVLDDNPKIKYVVVCNYNNVMASPHAGVIGRHVRSGCKITCEVVDHVENDTGGTLTRANNRLQIVENFMLPKDFVNEALFHNTNTMVIDVDVFRQPITWQWRKIKKSVEGYDVFHYERLLQQYTKAYETNFVYVPREARYFSVKTFEDMNRAAEMLATHRFK